MNKSELIEKITEDTGLNKTESQAALDSILDSIAAELKKGGKVTIAGFGTFSVLNRIARTGRNPQTGEAIHIEPKKVPRFKAGKVLSSII